MYDEDDVPHATPHPGAGGAGRPLGRLKAERVQLALLALPGWKLLPGGAVIARIFEFSEPAALPFFAAFAGTLAQETGRRLAVTIDRQRLECQLTTPEAAGVTQEDLELARRINGWG